MTAEDPVVTCGERVASCRCVKPAGHEDEVHACDAGCGGAWSGRGSDFRVVTYPSGIPNSGLPSTPYDDPSPDFLALPMPTFAELAARMPFTWAELEDNP